jgi:hypothetical protein
MIEKIVIYVLMFLVKLYVLIILVPTSLIIYLFLQILYVIYVIVIQLQKTIKYVSTKCKPKHYQSH